MCFVAPGAGFPAVCWICTLFTPKSPGEVLEELLDRKGKIFRPQQARLPAVEENPLTGVEERHATYTALLQSLTLALRPPGKTPVSGPEPEEIHRLGYKTTPVLGFASLAKRLREAGLYLAGVPGFYKSQGQ